MIVIMIMIMIIIFIILIMKLTNIRMTYCRNSDLYNFIHVILPDSPWQYTQTGLWEKVEKCGKK